MGSDSPPLFVVEIVFEPELAAVYVNVADGVPVERLTVEGLKEPPAPPSLGVIVVPALVPPDGVSVTVKLLDALPTVQVEGPLRL